MQEANLEFRKIKSLNFLYEIREDGRILRNAKSKKQIKIILDKHHSETGYYAAFICRKGKVKRLMIHALVAECWLGDKPDGMEIDHIDRNAHNNHYSNLRYVNHSEQMKNRVLSDRLIEIAKNNCLNYCLTYIAKPVRIIGRNEDKTFRSMTKCAEYLAEIYGLKSEYIRSKFKKRRHHIYDYDIIYLNAETRHGGSTEQGIVRESVSGGHTKPLEQCEAC